ncbi:MAG: thiamine diphosphokinase [Cellulosilyticaceae bacterium]
MKTLILTNGEYGDYKFCENMELYDHIICADNGMRHARHLDIRPDTIVGDFDSCNEEDLKMFEDEGVKIIKMPSEKDETDTELAVNQAIKDGATEITIWGGVGTRIDHSFANIHLLIRAHRQNIPMSLCNAQNKIQIIKNKHKIVGEIGQLVSLLPLSERVEGITTKGLAYKLDGHMMEHGDVLGVSNYLIENDAEIIVKSGLLLVMEIND